MDSTMERAGNFLPRVDESAASSNAVDRRVVTLTAPASAAAEQYRTLYYRLERMREQRPMKVVALTSAMPGEGKTVTSVNLALAAARANPERRILLVDADLRRGQVAPTLGMRNKVGLAELLAGECDVRDVVRRFNSTRLAVIPAGSTPEESTQVLASARMKQFLKAVREGFDEVYVDLPPTLPFADAAILGHQMDGVLMVIRANVTPSKVVNQAVEQLAGAALVGCVLNGAEVNATPYLKNYVKK
ncbi:CpsD/CapB family tyrosine-protein kinase [Corallococcus exiguus]|uniref:Polysaccharide biosynthesis tyrosine autokinase n=1 Tax=Corallococcus exiguus TaxID=83462 RepID=A0A7X5BYG3_9BACT|nr:MULTISPECIES: CpsD/CapB family tyrosine-protein kinase [Corallococcus]RKI42885.1 polysaccharide biosynthesis tyrosine autokinase [Corallococcus sp. AB004]MBN8471671.1 CpsD/CapB family tyrosine-protein kinase [Corallococcus exiguus]NBC46108.1 polysaccharide biosynthesis tyrosine autokinase [Corallococcus exiguus]NNB87177.1 CpsD/CapB family tyrosine-protein kinase [Corallococcus exiguus]NNB95145.1 CpsD/CapB family tyrosine-protein kinase [Corallococcus exiguus]